MQFRLVGTDFQSWKRFDLNVNGFTIIVGSSNRGKTAILRALRGVLRNQVSAAFVRHGQKTAEVSLEIEKGPTASLTRGKTTSYTVNGEDFAKLAGDVPKPIQDLNVHEITVGTTKLDPTFAGQFDSQFMMNLTPGDLNAVFGLFSNTERLNQGKKNINQNNTEINSQAKGLALDIQNGHVKLAALEEILGHFKTLQPLHTQAVNAILRIQTAQTLLGQRAERLTAVRRYRILTGTALPSTERFAECLALGKHLQQAQRLSQYVQSGRLATATPPLGKTWVIHMQTWHLLTRYVETQQYLNSMPAATPVNLSGLESTVWNYRAIRAWQSKRTLVDDLREESERNTSNLDNMHVELHDLTKDTTECPKCGYQFTTE